MATYDILSQIVNGDPYLTGGNINIVTQARPLLTFTDLDGQLAAPLPGEFVSFDGGATQLTYQLLGYGDVRGDPDDRAAFIRVDAGNNRFVTLAIDTDGNADLPNGNTKLEIGDLQPGPPFPFPPVPCFTAGTLIETPRGARPVEALRAGDLVVTRDHGAQPLLWVGCSRVRATGALAPVRIGAGVLGNAAALLVSPQHRILIDDWRAELFFGLPEVLVAAKHLVDGCGVVRVPGGMVDYFHLLFARHEVVYSNGIASESYFPGHALALGDAAARAELLALFPDLERLAGGLRCARPVMRGREGRALAA